MDGKTSYEDCYNNSKGYTWLLEFHNTDYVCYGAGFCVKKNEIVTNSCYFHDATYEKILGRPLIKDGMDIKLKIFHIDYRFRSALLEVEEPLEEPNLEMVGMLYCGQLLVKDLELYTITNNYNRTALFYKGKIGRTYIYEEEINLPRDGGVTCGDYTPIKGVHFGHPIAGNYFNKSTLRNENTDNLLYDFINESKMWALVPTLYIKDMPCVYKCGYGSPVSNEVVGMLIRNLGKAVAIFSGAIREFIKICDEKRKNEEKEKEKTEMIKRRNEENEKGQKRERGEDKSEQDGKLKRTKQEDGNTCFMDTLIEQTDCIATFNLNNEKLMRHATAVLSLTEGAVFIVDAAEGVIVYTERDIRHEIHDRVLVVVVISKVEWLITELKLPPKDAFHRVRQNSIETRINSISAASSTGNVCFANAYAVWSFILPFDVKLHGVPLDADKFSSRLWGDFYFDTDARVFTKKQSVSGVEKSFMQLMLETLKELYSQVTGKHHGSVEVTLEKLGVARSNAAYKLNVGPLLRLACISTFGSGTGFTDHMLVHHISLARDAASRKVEHASLKRSTIYSSMIDCYPSGLLMVNITKPDSKSDCSTYDAFGRVYCGELQSVHVLGEGYSLYDKEDITEKVVTKLWVYQARYGIPISKVSPGSWVLIDGVDESIMKTATLCNVRYDDDRFNFWPLQFNTLPVAKTATEPLNPNELLKMVEGFWNISKSSILATIKVDAPGEYTILGTRQLYVNSIRKDLRELYLEMEVKVADLVVSYCERVMDSSSLKCYSETSNTKNKITTIAESLEKGLTAGIEKGVVSLDWPHKNLGDIVQTKYDLASIAARSIWAFGPDKQGLNMLLDVMLSSELDNPLLNAVKDSVAQRSQWSARGGPLCDKLIRNVKFKIIDAKNAPEALNLCGWTPQEYSWNLVVKMTQ